MVADDSGQGAQVPFAGRHRSCHQAPCPRYADRSGLGIGRTPDGSDGAGLRTLVPEGNLSRKVASQGRKIGMTQRISHKLQLPPPISLDIWRVDEPDVANRESTYPDIQFQPGNTVQIIDAGGCCQTGGHGLTWKRWVDPSGPNSSTLYHGLIKVPGQVGLERVQDVGAQLMVVPDNIQGDLSLHLGYEDDGYSDNGYTDHDNGTQNQCSGSVNAFIELVIYHRGSIALPRQSLGSSALEETNAPTVVDEPGTWATRATQGMAAGPSRSAR